VLGLAGLFAAAALAAYSLSGIATALAIGLAVQAATYLTAPLSPSPPTAAWPAPSATSSTFPRWRSPPACTSRSTQPTAAPAAHTPERRHGRGDPTPSSGRSTRMPHQNGHGAKP
jgi:hypothetical protein